MPKLGCMADNQQIIDTSTALAASKGATYGEVWQEQFRRGSGQSI